MSFRNRLYSSQENPEVVGGHGLGSSSFLQLVIKFKSPARQVETVPPSTGHAAGGPSAVELGPGGCFRESRGGRGYPRALAPTHGVSGKSAKRLQRSPEPRPLGGFDGRPAGRPPRPAPPCRRTREAARPRQAAVALRLEPLLPRRPPPPASRRRGSSGQPTPPPPPPLPPLQPFGRCVTRRFLPTWRPGQVGGDGGQSAAAAGARPHRSQGSPALAGPLIRRLVPLSPRLTAAGLGSLAVSGAEGRVRGKVVVVVVAGKRPRGREKRRSHGRGPLGDGYDRRTPRPPRSRPGSPAPS
nr:basic salivary proline-rich protein 2-like [Odocoileus virginianus texanus]